MADGIRLAYLALVAAVGFVSFWGAPLQTWRLWRGRRIASDLWYHGANGLAVVLVIAWLGAAVTGQADAPLVGAGRPLPIAVRGAGLAAGIGGATLAVWARLVMGRTFAPTLQSARREDLVTVGPYGRIRHPFYVGLWLVLAGGVPALDSWATAAALAALTPLVWLLALREERALMRGAGDAYRAYAIRVPRFVPRPRRWT